MSERYIVIKVETTEDDDTPDFEVFPFAIEFYGDFEIVADGGEQVQWCEEHKDLAKWGHPTDDTLVCDSAWTGNPDDCSIVPKLLVDVPE